MRAVQGIVNGVLMVTLVKPMVRLMVGRWRKRMQESPAAALGVPMQELLEAALIEELAVASADVGPTSVELPEEPQEPAGRSALRLFLLAGVVVAMTTATAYAVAELIERRREAQARESELVAIPVEGESGEAIEDLAQEALVEEG